MGDTSETLRIGTVARLAGVGVETIRFDERQGLIPEPPRRRSGYRQYPKEAVDRIRFIRRAKELGFSLKEIKELLELRLAPHTTCADIRRRTEAKIDEVEKKIRALQRMRKVLKKLASACKGNGPAKECTILEAIEEGRL